MYFFPQMNVKMTVIVRMEASALPCQQRIRRDSVSALLDILVLIASNVSTIYKTIDNLTLST